VRESGATVVHYLGVMPAILLGMPEFADDDLSGQVRFGFGAGVNPRHHALFEHRFGFPLVEAWAMTETGAGGCIIANHEPRHVGSACFGSPLPAVEYRLVDESGADVAAGEPGELLVRAAGPDPRAGFFAGYLKNDEATRDAWAGGWLHTGDVVRAGADGSLHFVDRRKNVIRRSGENIAALEVEAALAGDPCAAELVVTAVEDEIRGEEVMACVVARPGVAAGADAARAIQQRALEALVYFKAPGYVVFVEAIPRTASQKPQRGEIKRLAAAWRALPSCFDLREHKRRPRSHA
jgi:acyl-coenzyme A synthetase/AMP-(fatty) acid ligase